MHPISDIDGRPHTSGAQDLLLLPLLQAPDEAGVERALENLLLNQTGAAMRQAIRRKLYDRFGPSASEQQRQDAEDVYSEALASLIQKLRQCAANPLAYGK